MLNTGMFLTVMFSSLLAVEAQSYCELDLSNTDIFILDTNYRLLLPSFNRTTIEFANREQFIISCPEESTNPYLTDGGEKVSCIGGTQITIPRTTINHYFTNLNCVKKLRAIAKTTDQECQDVGTHVMVGFEMYSFVPAYTVCFDQTKFVPLNATFNVTFEQWGAFTNETTEHYFVDGAHLYKDIDMDARYSNQYMTFSRLGVSEYHTDETYLIKGQLIPSYLFRYSLFGNASFNYANSVPHWSTLRNVFAEFVYSFITEHSIKPVSYEVGTSGVATLKNPENLLVELYLDDVNSRVPVPKWLWFTIEGSFTIYGYNNPYYEEAEVEVEFKSICLLPYSFEKFKDMLVGICGGDPNVEV